MQELKNISGFSYYFQRIPAIVFHWRNDRQPRAVSFSFQRHLVNSRYSDAADAPSGLYFKAFS